MLLEKLLLLLRPFVRMVCGKFELSAQKKQKFCKWTKAMIFKDIMFNVKLAH
jgi:hypothetical protein